MSTAVKETDLYQPIAAYLTEQGYIVRGEVNGCDIAAIKGEELIIVELKRNFCVDLLIQATRRQKSADSVYVAIPRPERGLMGAHWQGVLHVLRRLSLGLMLVHIKSPQKRVEVALNPAPFVPRRQQKTRKAVIKEIEGRSLDLNQGGSVGKELITAYRENAILIALLLERDGTSTIRELKTKGVGDRAQQILYHNVYGWFSRKGHATYGLTDKGREDIKKYPEMLRELVGRIKE